MKRERVVSESLASAGYNPETRVLEAEFTSGTVYRYWNVPPREYENLMTAPSKGRYFNQHIRDRYEYEVVG